MKRFAVAMLLFGVLRAAAGPTGSTHVVPATGYSGAYLGTVGLSLQADPLYGSRLLDSFELHLRSVSAMTVPQAVKDYLEVAVIGTSSPQAVKEKLGKEAMAPQRAAALLLAHALARPEQFREVLDGLEASKAGLGKHTAKLLREASGTGDKSLIRTLRARGETNPKAPGLTYDRFGELSGLFDGTADGRDTVEIRGPVAVPDGYTGYGPDGRPRRNGLVAPPRN